MKKESGIAPILAMCGACISFYIGAGFATMQEIVQYEASYGTSFVFVILVAAAIYIYTNMSFATNGSRLRLQRGGDIYKVYCSSLGKTAGKLAAAFFDWFSAVFCYMSFIVMCGGAGSTFSEQWGLPSWVGTVILAALVAATVVFGLNGIINSLSKLGAVIIIMILVVSAVTAVTGFADLKSNLASVDAGVYSSVMQQVGYGNPFYSGASYGGYVILQFAVFFCELGAKNKLKEVNAGMVLSTFFIFGAAGLCCMALLGHVDLIASADIPALVLAGQLSPLCAQLFALIICVGIYTSAAPLLWTSVRKIADENTLRYKVITVAGSTVGCLVACCVPYKGLINIIYGLNGYLGFVLVFFMILYDVKTGMSRRPPEEPV